MGIDRLVRGGLDLGRVHGQIAGFRVLVNLDTVDFKEAAHHSYIFDLRYVAQYRRGIAKQSRDHGFWH